MSTALLPEPTCKAPGCNKPLLSSDARKHGMCPACQRDMKAFEQYRKVAQARFDQLTHVINKQDVNHAHTCELCDEMVALFGGVKGVAAQWHETIMTTINRSPGSKNALDAFKAVARLIEISTTIRKTSDDPAFLSQEDIDRELQTLVTTLYPRISDAVAPDDEPAGNS